ncbi:MAG TPA: S9 family peptidase [Candidatus Acidoferrum sp.]|jgi:dipeptidyl aminopeptidase/acylaminoacyl peptidase|nr:S9 family peptidase [Candidatus Acidoferrum sp.]
MRFVVATKLAMAGLVALLFSATAVFEAVSFLRAQERPATQEKSQEKAKAEDSAKGKQSGSHAKEGTKQAVEARLKAVEHAKPADAAGPIHEVEKTLFATRRFEQAVISPDGTRVAWVETLLGKDGAPSGNTAIYISGIDAKTPPKRLRAGVGAGDYEEGNVAWSPDSTRVAFLSDAVKGGQRQMYVATVSGKNGNGTNAMSTTRAASATDAAAATNAGAATKATDTTNATKATGTIGAGAKRLTNVKGFLAAPRWSPDGKTIAVLFTENATRASGPLVAETHETGEIKDAFFEQRLAVVDVGSGKLRQISPADTYVYEYDWAPDGLRFAVTAALGSGDNNWWVAELYTLEAATGLMKSIYKPHLQIANPVWSPAGDRIAFVEGLMSDAGLTGGDILSVAASGGEAEDLTPEIKASPSWIGWTPEKKIVFTEFVGGDVGLGSVDPQSKQVEILWRGGEYLAADSGGFSPTISLAKDGKTMAFVRESYAAPPEVWAGKVGDWKQLTRRNEGVTRQWGDAKSLEWKNGGFEVQGWLLYPKNFDASKKYPLIVNVHGGPSWASVSKWPSPHGYASALAGAGYFVLSPNPRGSYGQGEAFTRANVKNFGEGDFADILAGVDEAMRVAPIDANRLGLTGWSYGGFITMFGVTQTNRFKAAMAGAGIANWESYYGENLIDQWMIPFFGKSVYDDPEIYAKSSAINFIKKVKTPTLVIVGDSDGECPAPQSYEFWHGLKATGVETQLVVYDHEGHMFAKPQHQRDVIERTLAWFDAHLK